ncbi:MAG: hypothetical protein JSV56_13675 [Methanomassiliicoccales archaeon]|nr:MAG: hypothetical protein JSV56_13675 [Methanomassiliicoccales archaeon]
MRRFNLDIIGKSYDIEIERAEDRKFHVVVNGKKYQAQIEDDSGKSLLVAVDGGLFSIELDAEPSSGKMLARVNDRKWEVASKDLLRSRESPTLGGPTPSGTESPSVAESLKRPSRDEGLTKEILAPMPGKVVSVKKNVGDDVIIGDVVIILEAMKMENEIVSNNEGRISEVRVKEGDSVDAHDVLVVIS